MVLVSRRDAINRHIIKTNKICKVIIPGISCILVAVLIIVLDPIHMIVNYNLRLATGSVLYNILQDDIKGAHLSVYLFNITNADRFIAGDDQKLKLEEVGPFVFQEYRWYEDLEMSEDGMTMDMTAKVRSELVLEESIGHPKDINLTLLNLPMLGTAAMLSTYPSFINYMFSTTASQMNYKAIINIDVHNYLWGYPDPLVTLFNNLVPGLVYFNTLGLLDRLYDKESDYRITVGATSQDRLSIKSVKKYKHIQSGGSQEVEISEQNFTDTYEGLGYPPELTPEIPINLYRLGICKTFALEYKGKKTMDYGGEGLVFTISNNTFTPELNPITKTMYPAGLMDISKCYFGLPYVVSKPHFLDADPKLLEGVDGMKPDKHLYINEIIVDRRVGVSYNTKMSLQLNLVLNDININRETRRFSNTIIPVVRVRVDQPKMSDKTILLFYLLYTVAPYCLIILELIFFVVGLTLLGYAIKSMHFNWLASTKGMTLSTAIDKKVLSETQSGLPLLISEQRK